MALLSAFDIARRALTAHETALGVISNNIANANSPGYARQVPELEPDSATISAEGLLIGRGVHVAQIRQVVDPLIERRLTRARSEQAGQAARRDELENLNGILGDIEEPGLSQFVDKFFDAADAVSRNPDGLAERENLLGTARALSAEFIRRRDGAATLQRAVDDKFVDGANQTNDALSQIASLNTLIVSREAGGAKANELRDRRALLIDRIAQQLPVNVQEFDNGGVRLQAADGTVLVDSGQVVHSLTVQTAGGGFDGHPLHSVGFTGPGNSVIGRPEAFSDGILGQLARVRDTEIGQAIGALDTAAASIVSRVNAIQTAGYDRNRTASTNNPLFSGTDAATISVVITDPRKIAAATSTEAGDNRNALVLSDLRGTGLAELNGATYSTYFAVEQGRLGGLASYAADSASASERVTQQLESERNEISGVNLNEELVNLLRFQRAFQGAAQVINVSNTVLDELIGLLR